MTETVESQNVAAMTAGIRAFLIADIRGYTRFTLEHGDAAAARLAARFAVLCRDAAGEHGGEVIELRGDEALAVFSSTRAAILAASDLQARVARAVSDDPSLSFQVGVGLDAGEALSVEGGFRGTALNLASRLCSLAGPGEVLASETITALARRLEGIDYRERGMMPLKGFDLPVRVMEVAPAGKNAGSVQVSRAFAAEDLPIGSFLGTLPEGVLVGRDAEVERSAAVIDAVLAGNGRTLLLAGEPGAGKTRLAQELTIVLRNRAFTIAAGRCYEPQSTVPFYPMIDALTALYGRVSPAVRAALSARWPDLARLLPGLGLPIPEISGQEDQQRLFWAVSAFLHMAAADRPVALLFDDLHWADAASLDLLQHLARHAGSDRLLLVGNFRDVEVNRRHPLEWVLRDMQREGLVERIDVRRLNEAGTQQLIEDLMGEEGVSEDFVGMVYGRTDGNPFFVQQVLRVLVDRGDVFRKDGRWDRRGIQDIEVPESVRSVVGQRLSRMSETTQDVLREASILGEAFTFEELQALGGRSDSDVEAALDEATGAGLIRERGRDGYAFDHALTRGALDAELSSRRRRRLHLAAGEALEGLPERKRATRAAELAWHFLEGDDPARALRWSLAAGDEAEGVFAHIEAERQYRSALQLAEEEGWEDAVQIAREKLGRVLVLLSRHDEAVAVFEAALQQYQAADDAEAEMRVLGEITLILFGQGRREEGLARAVPIVERWRRDSRPSEGACTLLLAVADLYWHAGRTHEALTAAERAVELAALLANDRLLGRAESRRGVLLSHLSREDEALAAYSRAIPLLERAGDLSILVNTLNNRALIDAAGGRMRESYADLDRSLDLARKIGTPDQIGWQLIVRAGAEFSGRGDWPRARALLDEAEPLERYMKGTRSAFHLTMARWLRLQAEDDLSMAGELERLAEEGERTGSALLWAGAQQWLALLDALEGREERAIERCLEVREKSDVEEQFRAGADTTLAWAWIEVEEYGEAETLIRQGLEHLGRGSPYQHTQWLTLLGRLRCGQGRWAEAKSTLDRALALARESNIALAEPSILFTHAQLFSRQGDVHAARAAFAEARDGFERMHAQLYVRLTDRAIAAL